MAVKEVSLDVEESMLRGRELQEKMCFVLRAAPICGNPGSVHGLHGSVFYLQQEPEADCFEETQHGKLFSLLPPVFSSPSFALQVISRTLESLEIKCFPQWLIPPEQISFPGTWSITPKST